MKRIIPGIGIGSMVGGVLTAPVSVIMISKIDHYTHLHNFYAWSLFWFIVSIGGVVGGIVGGFLREKEISIVKFQNVSTSIIFWSIVIFGIVGLETGFLIYEEFLIPLGNKATLVYLLEILVKSTIVGMVIGSLISFWVVLIRFTIIKFHAFSSPKTH